MGMRLQIIAGSHVVVEEGQLRPLHDKVTTITRASTKIALIAITKAQVNERGGGSSK